MTTDKYITYEYVLSELLILPKEQNSAPNFGFVFREIANISPKFWFRVSRNFAKFEENIAKHEIKKFAKITRNYEN